MTLEEVICISGAVPAGQTVYIGQTKDGARMHYFRSFMLKSICKFCVQGVADTLFCIFFMFACIGWGGFLLNTAYPKLSIAYIEIVDPGMINKPDFYWHHVYEEVREASGQDVAKVPLIIVPSSIINAATNGSGVYMYRGLLDTVGHNPDTVALIFAHELSHIKLQHTTLEGYMWCYIHKPACEWAADSYARHILYVMGEKYDACKGAEFFALLHNVWGSDFKNQGSHPPAILRKEQLCTPMETLDKDYLDEVYSPKERAYDGYKK